MAMYDWVFVAAMLLVGLVYAVFAVVKLARDVMERSLASMERAENKLMAFHNVSVDYYKHTRDMAKAEAEARNAPRGPAPGPAPSAQNNEPPLVLVTPAHGEPIG